MPLLSQGRRGSSKGKNMSETTPKINVKTLSQTERCFLDERLEDKAEYTSASMLWGERFSLQVGIQLDRPQHDRTIVFMSCLLYTSCTEKCVRQLAHICSKVRGCVKGLLTEKQSLHVFSLPFVKLTIKS